MIDGAREVIVRLRDHLGLVGFISGRGIHDLIDIVDIPGCAYAGNHGLELQFPDRPARIAEAAQPWLAAIANFADHWDEALLAHTGLQIERKGATLSVHWRTAPDPDAAHALLLERFLPEAHAQGLVVTWGRMVMEVRPPVALNKGTAVTELLRGGPWTRAAYVGDDTTDADAWHALHALRDAGALATAVAIAAAGTETPAELRMAADATVLGPPGVLELLTQLVDAVTAGD
jgi:trehalose 6-phosphate phosphatase